MTTFLKKYANLLLSVPVSILAVILVQILETPNPMMILIIPVVYFAYSDGYVGGTLSGLVSLAYSLYFFSNTDQLFTYNSMNIQKVLTIVMAVSVIVILVGKLKRKDELAMREKERNMHDLAEANAALEEANDELAEMNTAFAKTNAALSEANQSLDKAVAEAQKANEAKSRFLSSMSHEIRTPMNSVIGMTMLAKRSKKPAEIKHYLDSVEQSSQQLLSLINNILDISKIDADRMELSREPFDLEKLVMNAIDMIEVKLDEKKLELAVEVDEFMFDFVGDELRLSQVLLNLLSNAVKFTPEKGKITVDVAEENGRLAVSVRDTGIGMTPEVMGALFQDFSQGDGSITKRYGGTGLGLVISKKIVNLMGGELVVESTPGKGSVFSFSIPAEWGGELLPEMEEEIPDTADYDWENRRILLVDDNEINREIITSILEDTKVNIDCAENGRAGVDMYKAKPDGYDLIFMDVQMPVLDGFAATREIRASGLPGAETLPIIAMTANAFKEDQQECLDAGMSDYLVKPVDIPQMLRMLDGIFSAGT